MASLLQQVRPPKKQYLDRTKYSSIEEQNEAKEVSCTVYVGGLSAKVTEEEVYELAGKCGAVKNVILGLNRIDRKPCGFCFVEFYHRAGAVRAEFLLDNARISDSNLKVEVDAGFREGRQFGRAKSGGQVREERSFQFGGGAAEGAGRGGGGRGGGGMYNYHRGGGGRGMRFGGNQYPRGGRRGGHGWNDFGGRQGPYDRHDRYDNNRYAPYRDRDRDYDRGRRGGGGGGGDRMNPYSGGRFHRGGGRYRDQHGGNRRRYENNSYVRSKDDGSRNEDKGDEKGPVKYGSNQADNESDREDDDARGRKRRRRGGDSDSESDSDY